MRTINNTVRRSEPRRGLDFRGTRSSSERLLILLTIGYSGAVVAGASFGSLALGSLAKLIAIPFVICAILTYRRRPNSKVNVVTWCLAGIMVLAVVSYFWTIDQTASLSKASTFIQLFAATSCVGLAMRQLGRRGFPAIAWGLMIGALASAFMVFYAEINHTFVSAASYEYLLERVSAGASDPNDIALSMVITLPVFLVQPSRVIKLLVVPVGIAILLTGSRGGILAAVVMLLSFIFLSFFNKNPRGQRSVRPWQIIVASIAVVVLGSIFLPAKIIARFQSIPSQLTGGTLTNRTILWKAAWNGILNRPLTGYGIGSSPTYEFAHSGYLLVTHNVWLAFFLEIGVFGFVLFLVSFVVAFRGGFRLRADVPWLLPSLVALFAGTYALAWDYNKLLWLLLVLGGYAAAEHRVIHEQLAVLDNVEPTAVSDVNVDNDTRGLSPNGYRGVNARPHP